MLDCHRCGLTNRPYATACALCGREVQDGAAAEVKRREWEALPAVIRAEQEQVFDRARARTEDYRRWLARHLWVHALLGALLLAAGMGLTSMLVAPASLWMDLALGGAAGYLLNRGRGGEYRAVGLFAGAAAAGAILRPLFAVHPAYAQGYWLLTVLGLLFVLCAAYYLGLKMQCDHVERNISN